MNLIEISNIDSPYQALRLEIRHSYFFNTEEYTENDTAYQLTLLNVTN